MPRLRCEIYTGTAIRDLRPWSLRLLIPLQSARWVSVFRYTWFLVSSSYLVSLHDQIGSITREHIVFAAEVQTFYYQLSWTLVIISGCLFKPFFFLLCAMIKGAVVAQYLSHTSPSLSFCLLSSLWLTNAVFTLSLADSVYLVLFELLLWIFFL